MITPYIWGWGGSSKGLAFWGWSDSDTIIAALHDKDAVTFTQSERHNKAIQAGIIPKAIGSSSIFKAVKR